MELHGLFFPSKLSLCTDEASENISTSAKPEHRWHTKGVSRLQAMLHFKGGFRWIFQPNEPQERSPTIQ